MSTDESEPRIEFITHLLEYGESTHTRMRTITWHLRSVISDAVDWEVIRPKLQEGLFIHPRGIKEEAVDLLKKDLELAEERAAAVEQDLRARITELEARVSHEWHRAQIAMEANQRLVPENIRLRGLEKTLEELARLDLSAGGKIGP